MKFLSRLFIILGVVCLVASAFLFYKRYDSSRLAFADTSAIHSQESKSSILPVSIKIPSVGIAVPIHPAEITGKKWSDTKEGASYLTTSPLPGEKGNSVIYGHNYPIIFGNLTKVIPGDIIDITFSDGSAKRFEVRYTTVVTPDQTGVLAQSQDSRITIYTCTGFLDSERFIVTAVPLK